MSVQITCENCGAENRLGTIFCRSCGARLNLKSVAPAKSGGGGLSAGKLLARLIRLVILLALLGLLGALCWGVPAPGDAASGGDSALVDAKMNALRGAVLRRNEVLDTVAEADINAYVNSRIVTVESSGGAVSLTLDEVSLDLREDRVLAWMKTRLGPLPLTYTVETTLSRDAQGRIEFEAGKTAIGHVPMPGFLKGRVTGQFVALFGQFDQEYNLLNRLVHVKPADGVLEVGTVAK